MWWVRVPGAGPRPGAPRAARLGLVLLATAVLGCGGTRSDGGAELQRGAGDGPRVVTSMSVIADFAAQVGGERVEVVSLVPVGGDPHVHEPTPSDARAVADADLVLGNGAGLEPWFDALVAGSDREVVTLTDRIADRVVDDGTGQPDPHLWMVPPYATEYVAEIAAELAELDPGHAEAYDANADAYIARLEQLDAELAGQLARIEPHRRVLVTSHDAYGYFAEHYGLEVDTVVGVSTEEDPGAGRVQELVDRVREQGVPTVFVESTVNPAVMERIAEDAGVETGAPLYGDSVGEPGSGAHDYEGMMRANVRALVEGLA